MADVPYRPVFGYGGDTMYVEGAVRPSPPEPRVNRPEQVFGYEEPVVMEAHTVETVVAPEPVFAGYEKPDLGPVLVGQTDIAQMLMVIKEDVLRLRVEMAELRADLASPWKRWFPTFTRWLRR